MSTDNISTSQLLSLGVSLSAYRIFTNLPLSFTHFFGTGAPLFSVIVGLIFFAVLFFLTKKLCHSNSENIFSTAEKTFGKFGKYTLFILFWVYIFLSSAFLLSEFTEFAKLVAFPLSPRWFVAIFFVIAAALAALSSFDALGKISTLFVPLFTGIIIFFLATVLFQSKPENLFPVLGTAKAETLPGIFSCLLIFSDMLLIFLVMPSKNIKKPVQKTILRAFISGFFVVFLLVLTYTAKIPYPLSKEESFPLYLLVKEVYYGRFFQRIDAIILLISVLWGMMALSLNIGLLAGLSKALFGIKSHFISIFPISTSMFFAALFLSSSLAHLSQFLLGLAAAALFAGILVLAIFTKRRRQTPNEN